MTERVFYIDLFESYNSNYYWRDAFARIGTVLTFDTRWRKDDLEQKIRAFKPTHIHLGGSVKPGRSVLPALMGRLRRELPCTVSSFYGDCPYSEYHYKLSQEVSLLFISNTTHVKKNGPRSRYLPCPTEPRIFKYVPGGRDLDVVFVGRKSSHPSRIHTLDTVHKRFGLNVAGPGWPQVSYKLLGPAFGEDFSKLCGRSKIMLSIIGDDWRNLESYFSNRTPNVLACRCFLIQTFSTGIQDVFQNHKELVWYHTDDELLAMISHYLNHPKEREQIALAGQKRILQDMTFDHHVEYMIEECRKADAEEA